MVFLLGTSATTVSAMGPGMGHNPGMPGHDRMQDGSFWITTDIISIMANGDYPQFHFWYASDEDGSLVRFSASYNMIIEFEDANDDDAFQTGEQLYFAPLAAYEWTVQTGSIEDGDVTTEVWLKYTKSGVRSEPLLTADLASMEGPGSVERFADVTIQIWAHIYLEDYEGSVSDGNGAHANFTVAGGSELKMDITIGGFPFSSENSKVALKAILKENEATGPQMHQHRFETRERFRNVTCDSNMNWTTEDGNESRFERMSGFDTQKIDFIDSDTGLSQGFFSWLDKAVISWPSAGDEIVNVTVSYAPVGDGLAVYLAYPYFDNGSILHDPSIGLYENAAPLIDNPVTPILVAGIGGFAIIAILVILVRKK
ncbi:MAG: hypothetical protein ACFFEL_15530 [Candidatus Thorarchaeota archaeon]